MAANLDRAAFYASVRLNPFPGHLTPGQVSGMDVVLDECPPDTPTDHLAYCLATMPIETGWTMQPVSENLNYTSAARIRAVWPSRFPTEASASPYVRNPQGLANKVYANRAGNNGGNDGWLFRGRGDVQMTLRSNYKRATKRLRELGLIPLTEDLELTPDDAMHPDIAAAIMFIGMREGWFTGKTLGQFFGPGRADPKGARAIINGQDRAGEIALHWKGFRTALGKAGHKPGAPAAAIPMVVIERAPLPPPAPAMPPLAAQVPSPAQAPAPAPKPSFLSLLKAWIAEKDAA